VILLRHCEKMDIREHCAYTGYERSVYLASLFGTSSRRPPYPKWPAPKLILAERPDGRHNWRKFNFREVETVAPLAKQTGVPIDASFQSVHQVAKKLERDLEAGRLCGKLAVVAWKHSGIGHLASRLGCGVLEGCPVDYRGSSFDEVWEIKFVFRRFQNSNHKNLRLSHKPEWRVYGSVQNEEFDPLAFSKMAGDYPEGGTSHGGRWKKDVVAVPERRHVDDRQDWWETSTAVDPREFADTSAP
jgi:hypothetical protein